MIWHTLLRIFSTVLALWQLSRRSSVDKELEILLLRQQLAIYERKYDDVIRPSRPDRFIMATLTHHLRQHTNRSMQQLRSVIRIVQPQTVIKWHRLIAKRKWTQHNAKGGRPRIDPELEQLVLRLARENNWGQTKIEGELIKLGYTISDNTVGNVLKRHGIPPQPDRLPSPSWTHLMTHYKDQLIACDFFTIDTLFLKTIYVLFFIEVGSRCVHFAGCTTNPNGKWTTQQARQLVWHLNDEDKGFRFIIHDRDSKTTKAFDTVFKAEGIKVIKTPIKAPNANAFAERWVRSIREECLDKLIVVNQKHLRHVVREYINYYNTRRPHQGIHQQSPLPRSELPENGVVKRRKVLGGIINDYYRDAA